MLLLRAIDVILIEVSILYYSIEMPSGSLFTKSSGITVSDRALSERCMRGLGNVIFGVYATVTQISLTFLHK